MIRSLSVILAGFVGAYVTPIAAQDINFDETLTLSCYYESGTSGHTSQEDCFGVSADACLATLIGSTYEMLFCMGEEYAVWDRLLNEAYGNLRARLQEDANTRMTGAPSQVEILRDMQRAWVAYRDASCAFERARWGDGTGAGPAEVACLANTTAQQVFVLAAEIEMVGL